VFKKWDVVDVLAHLYIAFLENGPFTMMQIGLVRNAMQLVPIMWGFPKNVAPFNECITSRKDPQFRKVFPSRKGFILLIQKDLMPLLYISPCSLFLLVFLPWCVQCRSISKTTS
jgi:hypothetical protein